MPNSLKPENVSQIDIVADKINNASRIIVLTGAGISVSAGIPDFRSENGLFHHYQKYGARDVMTLLHIDQVLAEPEPFYRLLKDWYSSTAEPTPAHMFIRLLHEKKKLLKVYTQNVDGLHWKSGIPEDKLIEVHGHLRKGFCLQCRKQYTRVAIEGVLMYGDEMPEIENLVQNSSKKDFGECDLVLATGSTFHVPEFLALIDLVNENVPRILINLEKTGVKKSEAEPGFEFDTSSTRCVFNGTIFSVML